MYHPPIKILNSDIKTLTKNILKDYLIYGPVLKSEEKNAKQKEYFSFEEIKTADALKLNYDTSLLPPVKTFFPNDEKLISFKVKDISQTKKVLETNSKVLFGVHPCDLYAIEIMDKIFSGNPADENYIARRKNTIIIGLNCSKPCRDKCMCYDKGTYKINGSQLNNNNELCDIIMWESEGCYILEVKTQAGKKLIEKYNIFKPFEEDFKKFTSDYNSKQEKVFKRKLVDDIGDLKKAIEQSYNSNIWNEEGKKCLSCGSCNFVCPTCYCFETYDNLDITLEEGYRCRKWDACQEQEFSCIGSGENFREKSSQRNRHRIFKKEVYIHNRLGVSGCVGCGRCNSVCVANISLIDIYNQAFVKEII